MLSVVYGFLTIFHGFLTNHNLNLSVRPAHAYIDSGALLSMQIEDERQSYIISIISKLKG